MHKPNKITTSKYTPATFLPLNLYYQFTKYNNLFFLITLILLCIPVISPFTPFPYLIAFSLIIGVSMIKDALEDKERHKQDTYINKKLACIIRNGKTQKICVEDIDSGDIILVKENEEVPADIVLLSSNHSNCRSFCFVETSNLDGESNLKRKSIAVQDDCLCNKKTNTFEDGIEITNCDKRRIARIKDFNVEETGELLNDIKCIIKTSQENLRQNDKNVLLKGSRLKNTTYIIGLAISVGIHTKQSKNQIIKDMRVSLFERMVNRQLCFVFVGYFIVLAFTAMLGSLFLKKDSLGYLYLNFNRSNDALILTGTNYILFSYLVPISLFVTIEIARIFSGLFIKNDRTMQMGSDTTCRNTSVVEDLGIIDHILTDKTGTLTKNEMVLKYIHLYKNPHLILVNTSENDLQSNTFISSASFLNLSDPYTLFVLALLCCNSVERFNSKYEGQSQDEISILLGIKDDGQLVDRSDTSITIMIHGTTIKVPIIMVMDFTSKRQRMSVVVKVKNRFLLFSKGSDQMLLPLMKEKRVKQIIDDNSFYRSLVVGYKELENIGEYVNEYKKIGFERTGERIEEIFGKLEGGRLRYLGTTFVEDSLQDGISDTINDLKRADVRIWMITGDKKETAASCGMLCGMKKKRKENKSDYDGHNMDKGDNGYIGNGDAHKEGLHEDKMHKEGLRKEGLRNEGLHKNDMHNLNGDVHKGNAHNANMHNQNDSESKQDANTHNTNDVALPNEDTSPNNSNTNIQNTTNNTANNNYSMGVKERENKYEKKSINRFRKNRQKEEDDDSCEVISASDIIKKLQNNDTIKDRAIVYRASPEQKAKIARLLVHKKANVLSIGDGNNDVMMLQASNIGVGIRGSEGTQASLSADFSVPQFKCLKRLMFVHGRYTFMRFSKLCVNSLYKNLLLIFIQLYYNFFNGYSGRPIYNLFFLSYFNVLFTSIVPFYTSVFDKDRTEDELMNDPKDYKNTSRYFNHKIILLNVFLAVLKASIIFWPTYFCFRLVDFTKGNGLIGGYSALNNYFSLLVFFTVAFRQYRMIGFCNYFAYIAIGVTWILYFGTLFGVQEFNETTRNSAYHLYGMPVFYLSFIAIFGVVIMIDVMYDTFHHKICK